MYLGGIITGVVGAIVRENDHVMRVWLLCCRQWKLLEHFFDILKPGRLFPRNLRRRRQVAIQENGKRKAGLLLASPRVVLLHIRPETVSLFALLVEYTGPVTALRL